MTQRTYSEKEIALLLERAAELQAMAAKSSEHRPGLTLDELESVASEAGLDPSLLRKAAAELDQPQHALLHQNSGMTTAHVFVERRVPGSLTPELWEDVVAELRHHFDSDLASMMGMAKYGVGTTEQIGRTLEWRHTHMSGIETKLMIRPREDQLDVRMSQRVGWASPPGEGAGYGLIAASVLGMIGGAILDSAGIGVAIFLISLLAAVPLIIYADSAWREKKLRELESLAERVTSIVATPIDEAASEAHVLEGHSMAEKSVVPEPSSRIDSSALDDSGRTASRRSTSRRRSRDG